MAKYFTLRELTRSETAERMGIDNTPAPDIKHNLLSLMDFLDDLRWQWTIHCDANELGSGKIRVNSGYRRPEQTRNFATELKGRGRGGDSLPIFYI